jgi:hypothetical protein
MSTRYGSGRDRLIGHGIPQAVPITLDPAAYAGALVYGSDGQVYRSNGTTWGAVGALAQTYNTTTPNATVPVLLLEPDVSRPEPSIDVAFSPRGIGSFLADVPDDTVVGGNKRGHNSVDLQRTRSDPTQVASGNNSVIGGGRENTASGPEATISGGNYSTASAEYATVGGGWENTASGPEATISGGGFNTASGQGATVGGGDSNTASGRWATVGGGGFNTASGQGGTIFVGPFNYATVGGGGFNTASGQGATIGGGWENIASGLEATIGGGDSNAASGQVATVGGGDSNAASGQGATIGGGWENIASGHGATIGGGRSNEANGPYGTIPGGLRATTRGIYGKLAYASGMFAAAGDAQQGSQVLRRATTDATASGLSADGAAPASTTTPILPNNSLYAFRARVVCIQTGGTAGTARDSKAWEVSGAIKRGANAAATALLGTPTITVTGADAALGAGNATGAVIAVVANTSLGGLVINVTGQANKDLRWVATVETTEVAY